MFTLMSSKIGVKTIAVVVLSTCKLRQSLLCKWAMVLNMWCSLDLWLAFTFKHKFRKVFSVMVFFVAYQEHYLSLPQSFNMLYISSHVRIHYLCYYFVVGIWLLYVFFVLEKDDDARERDQMRYERHKDRARERNLSRAAPDKRY